MPSSKSMTVTVEWNDRYMPPAVFTGLTKFVYSVNGDSLEIDAEGGNISTHIPLYLACSAVRSISYVVEEQ